MSKAKKMEKISIDKLKENPENPRYIKDSKFKKLVQSIKEFPEMLEKRPIVVDEDFMVLGGNMRLKACKEAGLKKVYISIAKDWSNEKKKEFIIKDNIGYGEWDFDLLANEWGEEQLDAWGLDIPKIFAENFDDAFEDEGVGYQSQYGVIVKCENEEEQEKIYKDLTGQGFDCKVVVT